MTKLSPYTVCQLCGGKLVPPEVLPSRVWPYPEQPDYVCENCDHPFWWRGDPPKLIGLTSA